MLEIVLVLRDYISIVYLLGIPHIFYSLSIIQIVTFANLIVFIIQSCTAFNEIVFNIFSLW